MNDFVDFILFIGLVINLLEVVTEQFESIVLQFFQLINPNLLIEDALESEKG